MDASALLSLRPRKLKVIAVSLLTIIIVVLLFILQGSNESNRNLSDKDTWQNLQQLDVRLNPLAAGFQSKSIAKGDSVILEL